MGLAQGHCSPASAPTQAPPTRPLWTRPPPGCPGCNVLCHVQPVPKPGTTPPTRQHRPVRTPDALSWGQEGGEGEMGPEPGQWSPASLVKPRAAPAHQQPGQNSPRATQRCPASLTKQRQKQREGAAAFSRGGAGGLSREKPSPASLRISAQARPTPLWPQPSICPTAPTTPSLTHQTHTHLLAGTQPVPNNQASCVDSNKRLPPQPSLCTPVGSRGNRGWRPPSSDQDNQP